MENETFDMPKSKAHIRVLGMAQIAALMLGLAWMAFATYILCYYHTRQMIYGAALVFPLTIFTNAQIIIMRKLDEQKRKFEKENGE